MNNTTIAANASSDIADDTSAENLIIAEMREATAQKEMVRPAEVLRDAALKATGMDGAFDMIHPENIPLTQGLQQHGQRIMDAANRYIEHFAQRASFVARTAATKFDPKAHLAMLSDHCDAFMRDYGNYVVTPGAPEIEATASNLNHAATGYMNEYGQYLSVVRKPHPRVAQPQQTDELAR
jgi:hypothetical protein